MPIIFAVIFNPKAPSGFWLFVDNRGHIVCREVFFPMSRYAVGIIFCSFFPPPVLVGTAYSQIASLGFGRHHI